MKCSGLFAATIYAIMCFAQAASAGTVHAKVVVVHPPLFPLVVDIMRGSGSPELLLKPGQDSHHFQLSPSQAGMLANADIIIIADRGLSPSLTKSIQARVDKGATLIALTELRGADALPYRTQNHFTAASESKTGFIDPHLWLDPIRMAAVVGSLAARMGQTNMAYDATYRTNAEMLSLHLRNEVDNGVRTILQAHKASSTKDMIAYITYHDAYQYFEKRYGLAPQGYLTQRPEEYIGAKAMKSLMEAARKTRVRCLIAESHSPLAKRFSIYTQSKTVILSPERLYSAKDAPSASWVRNDYDRLLAKTAHAFSDCIRGKTD